MAGTSPLRALFGPRNYVKPAALSLAVSLIACASSAWAANDAWLKPFVIDGPPPLNSGMWLSRAPDGALLAVYRTADQAAGPSSEIANLVITRLSADSVQEWTAVWGAAPGTTDDRPSNVAQDAAGNLYIVDGFAYVAKFSAPGAPLWTYTHEDALPGDCTMRHHRSAVTPDGSVFYSAECSDGSLIGRISTDGEREWELRLDTVGTNADSPFIPDATAVVAAGLSVSPDGDTVYVTGTYAAPNAGATNGFVLPLAVADAVPDLDAVLDQGEFCDAPVRTAAVADTAGDELLLACADNSLMKIDAADLGTVWRSASSPEAPDANDGPPAPVAIDTDDAGRACVLDQIERAADDQSESATSFAALKCFDSTGPRMWRRPLAEAGASAATVTGGPNGSFLVGAVLTADYRGLSTALRPEAVILPLTAAGRVSPNTSMAAVSASDTAVGSGYVASLWDGADDVTSLVGRGQTAGELPQVATKASIVVDTIVTDDVAGDSSGEAVALQIKASGEVIAKAWSLTSGRPVASVRFAQGYRPLTLLHFEDRQAGLGTQALGVLGIDASGRARVQVRSYPAGEPLSAVWFGTAYAPIDALVLRDLNGNQAEEIAVLGVDSTAEVRVQIKDSLDGFGVRKLYYGRPHAVHGFTALPDLNGNLTPEIGVLTTNQSGARVLKIRDSVTGDIVDRLGFSAEHYPSAVFTVPNAGGGTVAVGVLGEDSAGRKRVQLRDARSGVSLETPFYSRDRAPEDVAVLDDQNGNGSMEIAVVMRNALGEARVEVRDSQSKARLGTYDID